jgi:hypothetical protein
MFLDSSFQQEKGEAAMNTPTSAMRRVGLLPPSPWPALVFLFLIVPIGCTGGTNMSETESTGMGASDMGASDMGTSEMQSPRMEAWSDDDDFMAQVAATEGSEVAEAVREIRAATVSFHDLNEAVAAGYSRDGGSCMANPPAGGMGFHHANRSLMDGTIEVRKPQILTYRRTADGEYELTGVEYVIPKDQWSDSEPPRIMGQDLRSSSSLGLWYLHVWVWTPNPNGLFADWNPNVECLP